MISIDVALGLIVVYLTFALALTALNEGIAATLGSRAKWLRRGLDGLLAPAAGQSGKAQVDAFFKSPFVALMGLERPPSYLDAWTVLQGALSTLGTKRARVFATVDAVREALQGLPADMPLRVAVEDLCARAQGDMEKFRTLLDAWFDGFEQQLIGWYRRKTQLVLAALAVAVAVAFNVDTLALMRQLSLDPAARKAVVDLALKTAQDPAVKAAVDARRPKPADPADPASAAGAPASAASAPAAAASAGAALAARQRDALLATGLELGWTRERWAEAWKDGRAAVSKLAGVLLSALAISLGAPFWFDLLKRVVAIRAVGLNLQEQEAKRQKEKAGGG